ncbi:unnamed protein product [Victoria cruziana]
MGEAVPPAGQQEVPAPRLLREFFIPSEYDRGSGGVGPLVGPTQYEIKAATINMLPSFHGLANEDPFRHLDMFLDVCATVKITNVEDGALRLRLFPFSLKDRARDWLKSLPPAVSIDTWEDLQREFLKKIFPYRQDQPLQKGHIIVYCFRRRVFPPGVGKNEGPAEKMPSSSDSQMAGTSRFLRRVDRASSAGN